MEPKELKIKIKVDKTELDEAIVSAREFERLLKNINELPSYEHQKLASEMDEMSRTINKRLASIIAEMPQGEQPKKTFREKYEEWINTFHPKLYKFSFIFCIVCFVIEMLCLIAVCLIKLFKN